MECLRLHITNLDDDPIQAALCFFRGPIQETLVVDYSPEDVTIDWLGLFVQAVGIHCPAALPKQKRIILVAEEDELTHKQERTIRKLGESVLEAGVRLVHIGAKDREKRDFIYGEY